MGVDILFANLIIIIADGVVAAAAVIIWGYQI